MMTGLRRWSWMEEYNRLTKSVAFICNATEQTFTANGLLPTVTLSSVCWKYGWTCVTNCFLCSSWLVEDLPWCWSVVLRRSWMMWPGQLVSVHKSVRVCVFVSSTCSGLRAQRVGWWGCVYDSTVLPNGPSATGFPFLKCLDIENEELDFSQKVYLF